jgi:ParB/RepB/Spo0J family partition protein
VTTDYREADLPLIQIAEPPHMLRDSIDPQRLGELADSIAAEGLHQRIGVKETPHPECFVLAFGHRRYLAHGLLGRATIAARIYPWDADELLIATSENLNREQLTPMEEAGAVERFAARGESVAGIARLFRRSPAWVAGRLALLTLPEDLQRAVHHGGISMAVASLLKEITHDEYRASLVEEATRNGASAAVAAVWVTHWLGDPARYATNHSTVEEIRQNREKFVLMIECEGCKETTAYGDTRAMRLCARCDKELTKALGAGASAQ